MYGGYNATILKVLRTEQVEWKTVAYNLGAWASEVEEHHANSVIRGHSKALEGLLEQNTLPHTHLLCE